MTAFRRRAAGFAAGVAGKAIPLTSDSASYATAPAEQSFMPGPVLLLGAPGVGKGTQAQFLVNRYGIPQISTGDLLRGNIASGTALGVRAQEIMAAGRLVDDTLVNEMVLNRLYEKDTRRGYILDGYPRTLDQANFLDSTLTELSLAPNLPVVAISIVVGYEQLLERITGRRVCPICKSIFNIYSQPPKTAGRCDNDCTHLMQRPDDTEEVFTERMKTFDQQTAPVIEHYRRLGRFGEVDGGQPVNSVIGSIEAALHQLRDQSR
ncbi:MAG TPA: adenylate kinase [Acidobacteriaceae bacterium]|nr:adenylate kinase [Acidobacteriaceae bacterium]